MAPDIKFLHIRLRAMAQATEIEERVLGAVVTASGAESVSVSKAEGHFGTPITVFGAELTKSAEMRRFIDIMTQAGIFSSLRGSADARTDEACTFHFRLDKQKASLGELALAEGKDVIDVAVKVGVYPARRDAAVRQLEEWLSGFA
jgi:RNA binding exosome subunit